MGQLVKLEKKRSYDCSCVILIGIRILTEEVEYVFPLESVIFKYVVINQA